MFLGVGRFLGQAWILCYSHWSSSAVLEGKCYDSQFCSEHTACIVLLFSLCTKPKAVSFLKLNRISEGVFPVT